VLFVEEPLELDYQDGREAPNGNSSRGIPVTLVGSEKGVREL
jgi:hypothetical protein